MPVSVSVLNRPLLCVQDVRQVGFYGDGYVMFDGVTLGKKEADISLSFFTEQSSALLLLGRDVNSDVSEPLTVMLLFGGCVG